jgi:acyl-CoA hydrolase
MFGDGVVELARAGALDPDWPHRACVFVGQPELYGWAAQQSLLGLAGCEITHGGQTLAGLKAFFAVNSAVEVDLWGQAALEHAGGAAISGAGGAPDFAQAARTSPGGASVVALPATAVRGTRSRIVAALSTPAVATLPRSDIDIVVTEFGAADLRGCSVVERAQALVALAAPQFREELEESWRKMLERL